MISTEQDIKMFQALNKSRVGKQLVDYLDRLATYKCDIRNLGNEELAGAKEIADTLDKIKNNILQDNPSQKDGLSME